LFSRHDPTFLRFLILPRGSRLTAIAYTCLPNPEPSTRASARLLEFLLACAFFSLSTDLVFSQVSFFIGQRYGPRFDWMSPFSCSSLVLSLLELTATDHSPRIPLINLHVLPFFSPGYSCPFDIIRFFSPFVSTIDNASPCPTKRRVSIPPVPDLSWSSFRLVSPSSFCRLH